MFQRLGNKALAMPVLWGVLLCCILGLAFAPMLRADPSEVPFIVVNLDEGVSLGATDYNIGQTLADALESGDTSALTETADADEDAGDAGDATSSLSLVITQMASEAEALEALEDTSYYGAIVIPEDFTACQLSATLASGEPAELTVYLNSGKNATLASSMQVVLMQTFLAAGITADVQTLNVADIGGGSLASTAGVQLLVMPLFMLMLVMSLLTALVLWTQDVTGLRARHPIATAGLLVVAVVVLAALAVGLDLLTVTLAGGLTLPVGELFMFLWPTACACMLVLVGLSCVALPLGAVVGIATMALGMGTAMLSAEMLPAFWADYVCPWVPQAFLGNGVRQVISFGTDPLASGWPRLAIMAAIGLVALALACIVACARTRRALQAPAGIGQGVAEDGEPAGDADAADALPEATAAIATADGKTREAGTPARAGAHAGPEGT